MRATSCLLVGLAAGGLVLAACSSSARPSTAGTAHVTPRRPTAAEARACAADPSGWMGCLVKADAGFGEMALTQVAIPGSHDSGTFDLDDSDFDMQSGSDCTSYTPVFSDVAALVARWSKTQDLDYPGQLDAGVRYLDVRVAYTGSAGGGWRIVHTLFSKDALREDMASIAGWARAHPSEVVVVDFQHVCYDNSPGTAGDDELWAELAPLAPVTYDASDGPGLGSATIDDIVHQDGGGHNVVLLLPSAVLHASVLLDRYHVHAAFTVSPATTSPASASALVPGPTVPEEYAWPSTVEPTSVGGETAANRALAAYPTSITPALGSLQGEGFYQSQLIYSLSSTNVSGELSLFERFGGLISAAGSKEPAWEAGLWSAPYDRDDVVAGWGGRLNVVVTDGVERGGFVAAVIADEAA